MTRQTLYLMQLCALLAFVTTACEPDRIEEKTFDIAAKTEKRIVGDRARNFVDAGRGEINDAPPLAANKDADLQGNFGAFEAFPTKSHAAYFLSLLETPSKERSVTFLGRFEGNAYLRVVFAPKANLDANAVEVSNPEADEEGEAKKAAKPDAKRQNLEMVRVIRADIDDLGEERLKKAIAKNEAIHAEGGFPYQGGLSTTEELLFRKRFEKEALPEED